MPEIEVRTRLESDLAEVSPVAQIQPETVGMVDVEMSEETRLRALRTELTQIRGQEDVREQGLIPQAVQVDPKPDHFPNRLKRAATIAVAALPLAACSWTLTVSNAGNRFLWGLGSAVMVGAAVYNILRENKTDDGIPKVLGVASAAVMFGLNMLISRDIGVVGVFGTAILFGLTYGKRIVGAADDLASNIEEQVGQKFSKRK